MTAGRARLVHAVVAGVTAFAVMWQLVLVVQGNAVLDESVIPTLGTRIVNFFSFFTIESNLLVLGTSLVLALDPGRNGPMWRVLRMNAVVGIVVTGVVHWFFLRPLLHLTGASLAVDKLLHVVVPLLAVLAWILAGPRGQANTPLIAYSLIWPVSWAVYTLTRGALIHWYPYPFLDAKTLGYPHTLANIFGIALLLTAVALAVVAADRSLARLNRPGSDGGSQSWEG